MAPSCARAHIAWCGSPTAPSSSDTPTYADVGGAPILTPDVGPWIIELVIGTDVGSYRITEKVSVGGMGTVYRAEHTLIGRAAAVKVLHPEMSADPDIVKRFFNEAKATSQFQHPGIVEVFDYGYLPSGHAYLVMEFLPGMALSRAIKTRGKFGEGEAAMLLRSICSALSAAHDKGIIHRDLKPDNIFLVPDADAPMGERPKLLDFGIAKLTEPGLATSATKTGAVMGTPTYMSPEQCKGTGDVDHRADLYALGCIFYELVAGRPPFTNRGGGELIGAHLYLAPEPPTVHNPAVSPDGEALIMALLAKNPADRPQTARELSARLLALAEMLGWVAPGSPTGHTKPVLRTLAEPQTPTEPDKPVATTPMSPPEMPELDDGVDKPTTLSAAVSVVEPRSRRRAGAIAGVAVALVVVVAAIVIEVGATGREATRTAAEAQMPQPTPTKQLQPTPPPQPPPQPQPTPPPQPPPPAEPTSTPPAVPQPPTAVVAAPAPTRTIAPVAKAAHPTPRPIVHPTTTPPPAAGSAASTRLLETDL
jgi:serine/threonine protein kinase